MRGDAGADTLLDGRGHAGANQMIGSNGANALRGGGGDDFLAGGDGDDLLLGQVGDDALDGGGGDDVLVGGDGSDLFVFDLASDRDAISDFAQGEDLIDVTAYFGSFTAILAATADVFGHAQIALNGVADTVDILGVVKADLTAGDFVPV